MADISGLNFGGPQGIPTLEEFSRMLHSPPQAAPGLLPPMAQDLSELDQIQTMGGGPSAMPGLLPPMAQSLPGLNKASEADILQEESPIGPRRQERIKEYLDKLKARPETISEKRPPRGTVVPEQYQEADLERSTKRGAISSAVLGGLTGLSERIQEGMGLPGADSQAAYGKTMQRHGMITSPLERLRADLKDKAAAKVTTGKKDSGKTFTQENQLRSQFQGLTKDFRTIRDSYGRVVASGKDPSAAGDLALIFNYMKILDPGSVVRESEFANAQNAAGVPDRVRNVYNRVVSGEKLAPEQRKDFLSRAESLYKSQEGQFDETSKLYEKLAKNYGLNYENIAVGAKLPSGEDKEAVEWARANPNDPRSAAILKLNGVTE